MTSLLSKKQIYTEGGYMLGSNGSGEVLLGVLSLISGLFGLMLSSYIILCFIQWISEVIEEKRWKEWKEWLN